MADNQELDSVSHLRNQAKIEREQRELDKLIKGHLGEDTEEEETPQENEEAEEVQEEKPVVEAKEVKVEEATTDEDLSDEEKTFKKRYGDLRALTQRKEAEWKEKEQNYLAQIEDAKQQAIELPKTQTDVQEWVKKYPEAASVIEAIAAQKAQENDAKLDARLKEIEKMEAKAKRQRAEAELVAIHPDFVSIRDDDAFHDWAEKQPKLVQNALYSKDSSVEEIAYVISSYKNAMGIKPRGTSTADEKAAASSVKPRTKTAVVKDTVEPTFSESMVAKMSDKDFEKNYDKIIQAQREGKFVYDLKK